MPGGPSGSSGAPYLPCTSVSAVCGPTGRPAVHPSGCKCATARGARWKRLRCPPLLLLARLRELGKSSSTRQTASRTRSVKQIDENVRRSAVASLPAVGGAQGCDGMEGEEGKEDNFEFPKLVQFRDQLITHRFDDTHC
jgi:hypothetical protein